MPADQRAPEREEGFVDVGPFVASPDLVPRISPTLFQHQLDMSGW